MAKNNVSELDTVAGNNADLGGTSILGTGLLSTADDSFRTLASFFAKWWSDFGGVNTVTGSANAIAVATPTVYGALKQGMTIAWKQGASPNSAATTLNVDSLGAKAVRLAGDVALTGGEIAAKGRYLATYDTAYNSAAGAWVLLNPAAAGAAIAVSTNAQALAGTSTTVSLTPANLAQERTLAAMGVGMVNGTLVTSTNTGARTIAIKTLAGADPSASDPVYIAFRDVSATTGGYTVLTLTAATSFVISSGSTMGFTSATPGRLWIVGFNDASTFRLGAVNVLSGTSIMPLRDGIYSSTAEGGAGAADSAQVIYTGTAVSSKPMRILGHIDLTETTAGTWANTPTRLALIRPESWLPGDVVQVQRNATGAVATGTTVVPADDTIPQNTEGDQYMTQAITPGAAANLLRILHVGSYANSSTYAGFVAALFQDSIVNALCAILSGRTASGGGVQVTLEHYMLAATTSSTTFNLRAGTPNAGTTTFNGAASTRLFGGVLLSEMLVQEIMA